MAFTYTTLSQALKDYIVSTEPTFVANLPIIVKQAEDRILKKVQLPSFRKNSSGVMTIGDQYLGTPSDFLAPYSLSTGNQGNGFLIFKDVNFIREAYPDKTATDAPKYYGIFEDAFFILGPTPDVAYPVELHYFYRPASIVDAGTSWLGTHAESVLLYGCLVEAYTFIKGDADILAKYQERYNEALDGLKLLGEGFNKTDSFRAG